MTSLWLEASRDIEADEAELSFNKAKIATASLWPFLALARSEEEFEHRLALTFDQIERRIPRTASLQRVVDSFRDDFKIYREAMDEQAELNGDVKEASMQVFHEASQQWVTVTAAAEETPGNPNFPNPTPEQGPITNETGNYPQHPTGADPHDPIQDMFPMQPTPWQEKGIWVDRPMNFAPFQNPGNYAKTSAAANSIPAHPDHPGHYVNEGVETGPGPNPFYFAGGEEGVAGDQQAGFPADISAPESMGNDRVDMYGAVPPLVSRGTEGDGHPYSNSGNLNTSKVSAYTDWNQFDSNKHYRRGRQDGYQGNFDDANSWHAKNEMGLGLAPHGVDYLTGHAHGLADARDNASQSNTEHLFREHGMNPENHDWELRFRESARKESKDNHGACYDCKQPVYRKGSEWHHLGQPPQNGHSVRLPSDHPWVQARMASIKREAEASSTDMGSGDLGGGAAPEPPPSMTPGGPGTLPQPPVQQAMTIPNDQVTQNPFPNEPAGAGGGGGGMGANPFMAVRVVADGQTRDRPDMFNPTGAGDEFTERTWDGQVSQSPRQPMEERGVNTPQRPLSPIPQNSSNGGPREEEEED
jgi:hypothetical protein